MSRPRAPVKLTGASSQRLECTACKCPKHNAWLRPPPGALPTALYAPTPPHAAPTRGGPSHPPPSLPQPHVGPPRHVELPHHAGDQGRSERTHAVYVLRQRLAVGPFEGEVIQAVRVPVVVGADHARVLDPRAVACLSQEALDSRGVAREPRPQYLERTGTALGVLCAVHFGRASLADALEEAVAGDGPTGEVLAGHGNARN